MHDTPASVRDHHIRRAYCLATRLSFAEQTQHPQRLLQPVKIGVVVCFAEEAAFAVVSTLHKVQRYAIKMYPRKVAA